MRSPKKIIKYALAFLTVITSVLAVSPAQAYADSVVPLYVDSQAGAYDVAVDNNGIIYVANESGGNILKIDTNGTVSVFADGFTMYGPYGIAVDGEGNVYASDSGDYSIVKYNPAGDIVWRNQNMKSGGGYSVGGIIEPRGLAIGPNGMLYYAEGTGSGNIHRVSSVDGVVDQDWSSYPLNIPWGVTFDKDGYMYVSEYSKIAKIDSGGYIVTRYQGAQLYGGLLGPCGIAVDDAGYIYIADTYNDRVVRADSTGNNLTVLGSGFNGPMGIELETNGAPYILVSDGVIQRIYPRPAVSGISPSSGSAGGGTSVTITGCSLSNPSAVYFGSQMATITDASNPGTITVTAPAGTPGFADVTVQGPYETSAVVPAGRFNYIGKADTANSSAAAVPVSGLVANGTDHSTITVCLKDSANQSISGHTVRLTQGSGASVISPSDSVATNESGEAVFTVTNTKAETVTYTVRDMTDGVTLSQTPSIAFSPGPPANISIFDGNNQSTIKNNAFASELKAKVTDANGNAVSGVSVTFTSPAAGASCTFSSGSNTINVNSDSEGTASATVTANGTVGSYTVTAGVSGVGTPAGFTLNNTPGPPSYTTWVVNDLGDGEGSSSVVTLRYAMTQAQNDIGDTITFAVTGTITLGSPLPVIHDYENLTITGPGKDDITISGNNVYRIFCVEGGTVSISGLTLADGRASGNSGTNGSDYYWNGSKKPAGGGGGGAGAGGGLLIVDGTVTLSDLEFSNCRVVGGNGGAAGGHNQNGIGWGGNGGNDFNGSGSGTPGAPGAGSSFVSSPGGSGGNGGDFAGGGGGGGSTYNGNSGPGGLGGFGGGNGGCSEGYNYNYVYSAGGIGGSGCGGAVFVNNGVVNMTDCVFSGNGAVGGNGGSGNTGGNAYGGAAFFNDGTLTLTHISFSDNSITGTNGGIAAGRSIYNRRATVIMTDVTLDPGDSTEGQVAAPVASPDGGNMVFDGTVVTITDETPGATIYYTTDGTQVTTGSLSGSGSGTSITLNGEPGTVVTVNVLAYAPGYISNSASFQYTIISSELIVTSLGDGAGSSTDITLRYALRQAQINNGLTIKFGLSGTILLTSPLPKIINDTVIDGTGRNITVSGDDKYRVFEISSGNAGIKNLTVAGGAIVGNHGADGSNGVTVGEYCGGGGGGGGGGGCGPGGGVFITGGSVLIDNVIFTGNSAKGGTGGNGGLCTGSFLGFGGTGGLGSGDLNNVNAGVGGAGGTGVYGNNGGTGGVGGDFAGGGGGGGGSGSWYEWNGGVGGAGGFGGGSGGSGGYGATQTRAGAGGSGGNGGCGYGGAIFIDAGTLVIRNSTFTNNTAEGGAGGTGGSNGTYAGASIYNRNGSVDAYGNNTFGPGSSVYNVALPPVELVWQSQPLGAIHDETLSQAPVLALLDACGRIVTNDSTSKADIVLTTPNGAVLNGTTTVTFENGIVDFSGLSVNRMGTYTFTVSCGAITSPASSEFLITARLVSINAPADISLANGTAATVSAFKLPSEVTLVTDDYDVQADITWDMASFSYDPRYTGEQNFSVAGTAALPDRVVNPNGVSIKTEARITVLGVDTVDKTLIRVSQPAAITGVKNGAAKTAGALGLPAELTLITNYGNIPGSVSWDVASCSYDPSNFEEQTFNVSGTVSLPKEVKNPNNVSLSVNTSVNVKASTDKTLISIVSPPSVLGISNYALATAEALGLPSSVTIVTDDGNMQAGVSWDVAASGYYPYNYYGGTFTIPGTITLPKGVANRNNVSLNVTIGISVNSEYDEYFYRNLISIAAPGAITGVENGTAKTASALRLPSKVTLVTEDINVQADVNWNVAACPYDPSLKTAQTFTVEGSVSLPYYVRNGNNVSLTVSIDISVRAEDTAFKLLSIEAPKAIAGLRNGTAKTAAAFGLPSAVKVITGAGDLYADADWDVDSCTYVTTIKASQTFNVNGTISLPDGVRNNDNLSLSLKVRVTVDKAVYLLTINSGAGGDAEGGGYYSAGTRVAITATPYSDYGFNKWTTSSGGRFVDADSEETTFIMPEGPVTVTANFLPWRTLKDKASGVTVSGYISKSSVLSVLASEQGSEGYKAFLNAYNADRQEMIFAYDISLKKGPSRSYKGELEITFPVGEQYNGQTLTLLHYINGTVEEQTGIVRNGVLSVTVAQLSPFAVLKYNQITGLPDSYTLCINGEAAFTPFPAGGIWVYDGSYLKLSESGGTATFTAVKAGNTSASYELEGLSHTISFTIKQEQAVAGDVTGLPDSYTLNVDEQVIWTPSPAGGNWTYDSGYLTMTEVGNTTAFIAIKAGSTTLTYTAGNFSHSFIVNVKEAGMPEGVSAVIWIIGIAVAVFGAGLAAVIIIKRKKAATRTTTF